MGEKLSPWLRLEGLVKTWGPKEGWGGGTCLRSHGHPVAPEPRAGGGKHTPRRFSSPIVTTRSSVQVTECRSVSVYFICPSCLVLQHSLGAASSSPRSTGSHPLTALESTHLHSQLASPTPVLRSGPLQLPPSLSMLG